MMSEIEGATSILAQELLASRWRTALATINNLRPSDEENQARAERKKRLDKTRRELQVRIADEMLTEFSEEVLADLIEKRSRFIPPIPIYDLQTQYV